MKDSKKSTAILFDFDGVILDSFDKAFGFKSGHCPHLTDDVYRGLFRGNINDGDRSLVHTEACTRIGNYFDAYRPHFESTVFFEGIEDFIRRVGVRHNLFIVSSCTNELINWSLEKHGVSDEFVEIFGNDVHESKVEKTNSILKRFNFSPEQTVFVTDTVGDIREAREAGVEVIAVSWGFHSADWLREAKPLHLVHSVAELEAALEDTFNAHAASGH